MSLKRLIQQSLLEFLAVFSVSWMVYILRCADHSLYTGVTTDLERRLDEHNHCDKKGAKYTRCRRPVSLVYSEPCADRSSACKRESALKKFSRNQKLALIDA